MTGTKRNTMQLSGLLSFPLTPFTEDDTVDTGVLADHVAAHVAAKPAGLFVAGVGADSETKQELDPSVLANSRLVVDVLEFNDETWFDRSGNFHSDALHVVERYTRTGPDHIAYEVTIEDPKVFTRPWKMSMPLYRRQEKNAQILDYECHALEEQAEGRLK